MRKIVAFGFIAVCGSTLHAQTINVHGKISNSAGQPVISAVVQLVQQGLKDTTGSDGMYSLSKNNTAVRGNSGATPATITFEKGVLELAVSKSSAVKVETFDVKGNLLEREALDKASPGIYDLNLAGRLPAENMVVVKATVGSQVQTFRYLPNFEGNAGVTGFTGKFTPAGATLAKVAATVDTLKVSASGFATQAIALSSFDTTINVTLDSSDRWGGPHNPPVLSAGCGKPLGSLKSGAYKITSSNQTRTYIIDIPTNYDMNHPYKFFYCSHWIGAKAQDVVGQDYYWLKDSATADKDPAIFLAPQALPGDATLSNNPGGTWSTNTPVDQIFFSDLLDYVEGNLCIDTTRVFATGFSFGGMMTYSLSTTFQSRIRAAVGIAPANYNIYLPNPLPHDPIAWMQTTGMSDGTCPWVNGTSTTQGSKYIALGRGADNGCVVPSNIPTWTTGPHLCYDFQGCKTGYPVKACTFNGLHTNINNDPGSNTNWIPAESWKFFSQF